MTDPAESIFTGARDTSDKRSAAKSAATTFEESLETLLADGYRVALAILRHRQEAEDAVQEAVISVERQLIPPPEGHTAADSGRAAGGANVAKTARNRPVAAETTRYDCAGRPRPGWRDP